MIDGSDRTIIEGGSSKVVGAVDADGVPFATRAWAITLSGAECRQARLVVSADPKVDASMVGRHLAVTATDVPTLVSRQLKGTVVAVGEPSEADLDAMSVQTEGFIQAIHATDAYPLEVIRRMIPAGVVLMEIVVDELYDQTPGPSAGGRLEAAER